MIIRCYFDYKFEGVTGKGKECSKKGTSVFSYENSLPNDWYKILCDMVKAEEEYCDIGLYEGWGRTDVEIKNVREINEKYLTPDDHIGYIYEL